jgi:hypothetical protein
MTIQLDDTQRPVLRVLCDTFVLSINVADDPTGFWARTASDLGVDTVIARYLVEDVPQELRNGLLGLLPQVAAACGSLQSPALLLRSGIGGPNVGKYFRVQPGRAALSLGVRK